LSDKVPYTTISPEGSLTILSHAEVNRLLGTSKGGLYDLFRKCSLAVLNSGSRVESTKELLDKYHDFDIRLIQQDRGIKLELINAPAKAFVDGKMIKGIREHMFSVLRDIVFMSSEIYTVGKFNLKTGPGITNAVFHILRHAGVLKPMTQLNIVVCWGGHSITGDEYDYAREVGHEFGLRGLNICTGCGPGAMKGPMKGAAIGHAKQRLKKMRYIGVSEPGIIAAESPNPIVNELVILPDIEKRLESFLRMGHGIVVFPGGVGTAEEILFVLGTLLHPDNNEIPFPLIFTGNNESEAYFKQIDKFIKITLGENAAERYKIIINDPVRVAREILDGMELVWDFRKKRSDAFFFNWKLTMDKEFQLPFHPTHENMYKLKLHKNQSSYSLAANLRKLFSGIVSGNLKAEGIAEIEKHGPFKIRGHKDVMEPLDELLNNFITQGRMKPPTTVYEPCYRIV
jgi:predicted Rossmann-fold nucleotide-binding protein